MADDGHGVAGGLKLGLPRSEMAAADFEAALLRFIKETLLPDAGPGITSETYLFADGLVNSMRILDLVAFVEYTLEREIRDVDVTTERFRTVGDIVQSFAGRPGERH
jgi:acyl carrier protein